MKKLCTFILETAYNVGRGHGRAVAGEAFVKFQHVLWRLRMCVSRPLLGPVICEVYHVEELPHNLLHVRIIIWLQKNIHWHGALLFRRWNRTTLTPGRQDDDPEAQGAHVPDSRNPRKSHG